MNVEIRTGDALELLRAMPADSVDCVVTSPPYYGLRDYDVAGQIGLEGTPSAFVARLVEVFREVRRVLKAEGTCWVNLGDSYASDSKWGGKTSGKHVRGLHGDSGVGRRRTNTGLPEKNLLGIPWRVAFALQDDGWFLRQDIIWHKPNPMPESVQDRCTKAHEYMFLLTKSARYFYDADAIAEGLETDPKERYEERARVTGRGEQGAAAARGNDRDKSGGFPPRKRGVPPKHAQYESSDQSGLDEVERGGRRNKRSVWTVASEPFRGWGESVRWGRAEAGAHVDGMMHITFPDCPSYGGLFDLLAMAVCDGHEGDDLFRILHSGDRLSEVPRVGFVAFETLRDWRFEGRSLSSILRCSSWPAICRSTGSHKTGLYVSTSPPCMPSAQRLSRIARTLEILGSSPLHLDTSASKIWESGFSENQRPKTLWRTVGIGEASASFAAYAKFFVRVSEKVDHFATFPPALIEPCILAGCPIGGLVLDPFGGSGTTAMVANRLQRNALLLELNPKYVAMARRRISDDGGMLVRIAAE